MAGAVATVLLVLLLLAAAVIIWGVAIFNRLITLRNRFKNAYAQIDVQLQRRHDLIPNLVETTKAYLNHEKETLEAVIQARQQAVSMNQAAAHAPEIAQNIKNVSMAETNLGGALSRLMAVVESYPDLKANQNVMQLKEELSSTENRVAFARQAYNDSVMVYNTNRETFPNVLIAGPLQFKEAQLFETTRPEEREAPKVSFA